MALDLEQNNSTKQDFGRIEDGTYSARVAQIIDIGRQQETAWVNNKAVSQFYVVGEDGKSVKNDEGYAKKTSTETSMPCIQPKVFVTFEFPTETIEIDGEQYPRWQSKEYNVTNSGALYKLVKALAPDASKISDIAGLPCMVQIGSTSGGNAKIASVGPLMKGLQVEELSKGPIIFDMSDPNLEVFNNLPNFLKEKIKSSEDFSGSTLEKMLFSKLDAEEPASQSAEPEKVEDFSDDTPF